MYDNDTLVINFGHNYAQQNATFGRIGTLCEGYGVERNVLPKEASAIGARAVGHDYTSTELALFYNLARGQSLNRSERQLRELVIENGLIADVNGTYEPVQTESCIISFIHNSQWRDILAHELSHAEYFTNDTYREYCNNFWNEVMTPDDRKGFTNFLRWDYYDITNTDLTINETQAYLANTCDMYSSSLFNMPEGRADELRAQFIKDSPVPSFCETLDSKINGEQ